MTLFQDHVKGEPAAFMYFPNLILQQVCTHQQGDPSATKADAEMTGCESLLRQLLASLVACLGAFSAGCGLAWPSVGLRGLKAESIELSAWEESQLVSVFLLAAAASPLPSGLALSTVGRRLTLCLLSLPLLAGWLLLAFSPPSLPLLLTGRILTGFAGGAFLLVSTAYSEEVAEPRLRGAFGSMAQLLLTIGIFFIQVNCKTDWRLLSGLCAVPPALLLISMVWLPPSPVFLASKGKQREASSALRRLRGRGIGVEEELKRILEESGREGSATVGPCQLLRERKHCLPFLLAIALMTLAQLVGVDYIISYTTIIFEVPSPLSFAMI